MMLFETIENKSWLKVPLKRFLRVSSGEMISSDSLKKVGVPVVGGNGIRGYTDKPNSEGPALVIGRVGAKCGITHLIPEDFWASEHALVVYPKGNLDLRYGYYLLNTLDLNSQAIRTAQPLINTSIVENSIGIFPPLQVQRHIAAYLDEETTRIDALIDAKERLLQLLKEKKQAIITKAVTRGIEPGVKMKDSGIEWLGEVPEDWEVVRIFAVLEEKNVRDQPELPLMEVSINRGVAIREFTGTKVESVAADFNTYKVAEKGDIVFNKMRMWQGAVGVAPVDGLVSPDYTVSGIKGEALPEFLGHLFKTPLFNAESAKNSRGITWDRLRLYWDGFRDIYIALPDLSTQQTITEYIHKNLVTMAQISSKVEGAISLLKERRSSLISEAVTGQIEIPEK